MISSLVLLQQLLVSSDFLKRSKHAQGRSIICLVVVDDDDGGGRRRKSPGLVPQDHNFCK